MRVVVAEPPMMDEIDAAFDVRGKPVLFAWGDTIYNPAGVTVSPELMAHERVHGARQRTFPCGVEDWWRYYISSPRFRLLEEIPAHVDEFLALCAQHGHKWPNKRNMRRAFAAAVAKKLTSPLYRYDELITFTQAKRWLQRGAPAEG